jgi:hypothetical protein
VTPDLLLRADALPGLLDGWVGPVVVSDTPHVYWFTTKYGFALVFDGNGETKSVRHKDIALDLSLPEVRDRVARVLARVVGLECGSTAPGWSTEGNDYFDPEWCLAHPVWTHRTRYFIPAKEWGRLYHHDRAIIVPSLSTLDPSNPASLPDGSRWVDARALVLVAQHVGAK